MELHIGVLVRERERERESSLYISERSDRRDSWEQEAKLFYTTRATRGSGFKEFRQTP